jgi:hypothetical protein
MVQGEDQMGSFEHAELKELSQELLLLNHMEGQKGSSLALK